MLKPLKFFDLIDFDADKEQPIGFDACHSGNDLTVVNTTRNGYFIISQFPFIINIQPTEFGFLHADCISHINDNKKIYAVVQRSRLAVLSISSDEEADVEIIASNIKLFSSSPLEYSFGIKSRFVLSAQASSTDGNMVYIRTVDFERLSEVSKHSVAICPADEEEPASHHLCDCISLSPDLLLCTDTEKYITLIDTRSSTDIRFEILDKPKINDDDLFLNGTISGDKIFFASRLPSFGGGGEPVVIRQFGRGLPFKLFLCSAGGYPDYLCSRFTSWHPSVSSFIVKIVNDDFPDNEPDVFCLVNPRNFGVTVLGTMEKEDRPEFHVLATHYLDGIPIIFDADFQKGKLRVVSF